MAIKTLNLSYTTKAFNKLKRIKTKYLCEGKEVSWEIFVEMCIIDFERRLKGKNGELSGSGKEYPNIVEFDG